MRLYYWEQTDPGVPCAAMRDGHRMIMLCERQDQQVAAGAIVEDGTWLDRFQGELRGLLAPVFAQARSRLAAFAYIGALLAEPGNRRSCWQLAERAGHATPRRMQALLAEHAWDWTAALAALQRFILARLGDPAAIVVLDETAELTKGDRTVGVARQHAGITGQVENCQTVVFAAYVTARAHTLFDFRLYLPKQWCKDEQRRQRAHVPDDVEFATKPALGTAMITGAAAAGAPFAWMAADEVYGRSGKLREACEKDNKGYVVAVPVNFTVTLPSGRKTAVAAVARLIPATTWETRSCGPGCKGHRDYAWAWAATASARHWVLIRRSLAWTASCSGSVGRVVTPIIPDRGPSPRISHARPRLSPARPCVKQDILAPVMTPRPKSPTCRSRDRTLRTRTRQAALRCIA